MKKVVIIVIIIIAGFTAYLLTRQVTDEANEIGGDQVPDLVLNDFNANEVRIRDFVGRPTVINSWAVWCPFCREELLEFAKAQLEYGDEVVIIAIDRSESLELQKLYTDELGVTEKIIFLLDPKDSFYQSIGGFAMPETIFVSREGTIRFHKRGPMQIEEIRDRINALLTD